MKVFEVLAGDALTAAAGPDVSDNHALSFGFGDVCVGGAVTKEKGRGVNRVICTVSLLSLVGRSVDNPRYWFMAGGEPVVTAIYRRVWRQSASLNALIMLSNEPFSKIFTFSSKKGLRVLGTNRRTPLTGGADSDNGAADGAERRRRVTVSWKNSGDLVAGRAVRFWRISWLLSLTLFEN